MGGMGDTGRDRDIGDMGWGKGVLEQGERGHEDVWAGEMGVPELEGRGHEGIGVG